MSSVFLRKSFNTENEKMKKEIIVLKQNSLFIILYPKINNGIFINKLIIPNVFNDFGKTKNLCIK